MTLPPTNDSRSHIGIVVTLRHTSDGKICLVLDDVHYQAALDASLWRHERFFTAKEYSSKDLQELRLSKEQFAEIGENIILRLTAGIRGAKIESPLP